ncbi:hypothetical protein GCM10028791_15010 [Echinicola sediminis]
MKGGPTPSKMAYAELINRQGERMAGTIIPLDKGQASASLSVPAEIPSDHYLFRLYTRLAASMKDEKNYHHSLITVINPHLKPKDIASDKVIWKKEEQQNPIEMSLSKELLDTDEAGKLTITGDAGQEVTVSISRKNPFLADLYPLVDGGDHSRAAQEEIVPELRGHIIKGLVSENTLDTSRVYFLSAHGNNSALYLGKANKKGEVYFELGPMKAYDFLLLQTAQTNAPFDLSIQQPFAPAPGKELLNLPPLVLTKKDQAILDDLVLSYSTSDYYQKPVAQEPLPIITGYTADRSYNLDEYNRFEDLATTLKEYVPTVLVRKNSGKYHFRLANFPENRTYKDNPLMLIDAMPVFNSDALGNYQADSIERIEVINRNFYIGDNRFDGAINFKSFGNDFGGFPLPEGALYLEYPQIQQPMLWKFNTPQTDADSHLPDFRTILYWGEHEKIGPDGKLEIPFNTSMVPGEYEIRVSTVNGSIIRSATETVKVNGKGSE